MAWLVGKYEHQIDDKGRIILPAKFRRHFEEESYLSEYEGDCLALWSSSEFESQAKKRAEEETQNPQLANKVRRWAASIHEVKVDRQGRIQIPLPLREYAGLRDEVIITGVMNRVEIWAREKWETLEV